MDLADYISVKQIEKLIDAALAEDLGRGDITSQAIIPGDLVGKASIIAKEAGVLAGGGVAIRVFQRTDPTLETKLIINDGSALQPGDTIATITGGVPSILKAERVALNFLQRLGGIATLTARFVAAAEGLPAKITDTRKTTPGMRMLEKYAVRVGGGHNHRLNLSDAVLIKDNHIAALRALGLTLKDIVSRAKQNAPAGVPVEIEVTGTAEAQEALKAGADTIMLDNMSPHEMRQVVKLVAGRVKLEASGGVTLDNIHDVAMTGVDIISIGALTHSPKALDISLELEPQTLRLL